MALRLLPIVAPCTESFAAMPGDDRTRFCDKCGEHVHNLSAGTEPEARALFREAAEKKLCVRYARDPNGAIRFRSVAMAAAAAMSLSASLTACSAQLSDAPPAAAPSTATATAPATASSASSASSFDPALGEHGEQDWDMGDGILDVVDKCPDDGSGAPDDGCPDPAAPSKRP